MANKDLITNGIKDGTFKLTAKKFGDQAANPELDKTVFNSFQEMRNPSFKCKPLPISRLHIQERARLEARRMNLHEFSASDGWFRNWRKRNDIGRSVRLWGEAGDHTEAEFRESMTEMRESLEDFSRDNTFNMDETGLFYKTMPAKTYLGVDESRKTVRGTKALKAKDRVTLLFCVNATGILF